MKIDLAHYSRWYEDPILQSKKTEILPRHQDKVCKYNVPREVCEFADK